MRRDPEMHSEKLRMFPFLIFFMSQSKRVDAETIISISPRLILSSHIYSFIISPAEPGGCLIKLGCGTNFYTEKNVGVLFFFFFKPNE